MEKNSENISNTSRVSNSAENEKIVGEETA